MEALINFDICYLVSCHVRSEPLATRLGAPGQAVAFRSHSLLAAPERGAAPTRVRGGARVAPQRRPTSLRASPEHGQDPAPRQLRADIVPNFPDSGPNLVDQIWPKLLELGHKLVEIRPMSVEIGRIRTISAQNWSILGRVWPKLADSGRRLVGIGRFRDTVGRHRPIPSQLWSIPGQTLPNLAVPTRCQSSLGLVWVGFGPTLADFGPSSKHIELWPTSKVGQSSPTSAQIWPHLVHSVSTPAELGPNRAKLNIGPDSEHSSRDVIGSINPRLMHGADSELGV